MRYQPLPIHPQATSHIFPHLLLFPLFIPQFQAPQNILLAGPQKQQKQHGFELQLIGIQPLTRPPKRLGPLPLGPPIPLKLANPRHQCGVYWRCKIRCNLNIGQNIPHLVGAGCWHQHCLPIALEKAPGHHPLFPLQLGQHGRIQVLRMGGCKRVHHQRPTLGTHQLSIVFKLARVALHERVQLF